MNLFDASLRPEAAKLIRLFRLEAENQMFC